MNAPALRTFAVCLAGLVGIGGGCSPLASRGMNAEGVRLFQQSQYQQALQQFQQAIYQDPANADGYYNMAATYHRVAKTTGQKADWDHAESLYNQCLDRDPQHRDCYRGLAVLLVEQKRTQEAFRLLQGWADRQPISAEARVELARLWEEFGDKKVARDTLVEALAIDPNNTRALAAMGKLREEAGERAQALANYQRSLFLNRFQPELQARVAALQTAAGGTAVASLPPADRPSRIAESNPLPRR